MAQNEQRSRRWWDVRAERRWMPIGRQDDPKAPAYGYATNRPDGGVDEKGRQYMPWMPAAQVSTPMAGLNFGPVDGLVGIDMDYKPKLARDKESKKRAHQRMGEIKTGLLALGLKPELSHSGVGRHFFAMADAELLAELKRRGARSKAVIVAGERGKKEVAAVEMFGGGNAYIAVTWNWEDGEPDELPVLTLEQLLRVVPEWKPAESGQHAGQQSFGSWPPSGAAFREDDVEYATRVLLETEPPDDYGDWVKVLGAAKASGVSLEDADRWSRAGAKYQPGEVDQRWSGLGGNGVSIGTLVDFAKSQGVDVRRRGNKRWRDAGRRVPPPNDAGNASESHEKASDTRPNAEEVQSDPQPETAAYMGEYACFLALVNRYGHRMRYLVDSESSGTVLVSDDNGCWMGFSTARHSPSRALVMKWLGAMVNDGEVKDSDRAGVLGRIMDGGYELEQVSWSELNAFDVHPCVPTKGGAIDLLSDGMLTVEQTRALMFRQVWSAPLPDMSVLAQGHAGVDGLLEVFAPAMDLFAYCLAVRGKSIAQVKVKRKNLGKSTTMTLAGKSFGDAVHIRKQTKRLPDGEGFSDILSPLGNCLVLVFDEMNQIKKADNTAADRLVSDTVELHFKYQTPYQVLRLGSPFMIGNNWPGWDYADDGMVGEPGDWGRVDELCMLLDETGDTPVLSRAKRRALLNDPSAVKYLQAWILARARVYAATPDESFGEMCLPVSAKALQAGRADMEELVKQAEADAEREVTAEKVQELVDSMEYTGDDADHVSTVVVKERLGRKPHAAMPPEMQPAMEKASGGKRPMRKTVVQADGTRPSCYIGWRWRGSGVETAVEETPCRREGCSRAAVEQGYCLTHAAWQ